MDVIPIIYSLLTLSLSPELYKAAVAEQKRSSEEILGKIKEKYSGFDIKMNFKTLNGNLSYAICAVLIVR